MSRYNRSRKGHLYFVTVVTHRRRPILTTDIGHTAMRTAINAIRADQPFSIVAIVLRPDHLQTVWELPRCDADYSTRWRRITDRFTKQCRWRSFKRRVTRSAMRCTMSSARRTRSRRCGVLVRGERSRWRSVCRNGASGLNCRTMPRRVARPRSGQVPQAQDAAPSAIGL